MLRECDLHIVYRPFFALHIVCYFIGCCFCVINSYMYLPFVEALYL